MTPENRAAPSGWGERLRDMEQWYQEQLGNPSYPETGLLAEYAPYAARLSRLRGRILDLGGGIGPCARFLDPSCDYVVVDPSDLWADAAWSRFGASFRADGPVPTFVHGFGEALPFPDHDFDQVLAMWSMNHTDDPAKVAIEIARVLRPGGEAMIVLEDMVPSWRDLASLLTQKVRARFLGHRGEIHAFQSRVGGALKSNLRAKLTGQWFVQDDHILLREADLIAAFPAGMSLVTREWIAGYLTLTFKEAAG